MPVVIISDITNLIAFDAVLNDVEGRQVKQMIGWATLRLLAHNHVRSLLASTEFFLLALRLISHSSNNETAPTIQATNCLISVYEGLHANLPSILAPKPQVYVLLTNAHSNSKDMTDGTGGSSPLPKTRR